MSISEALTVAKRIGFIELALFLTFLGYLPTLDLCGVSMRVLKVRVKCLDKGGRCTSQTDGFSSPAHVNYLAYLSKRGK